MADNGQRNVACGAMFETFWAPKTRVSWDHHLGSVHDLGAKTWTFKVLIVRPANLEPPTLSYHLLWSEVFAISSFRRDFSRLWDFYLSMIFPWKLSQNLWTLIIILPASNLSNFATIKCQNILVKFWALIAMQINFLKFNFFHGEKVWQLFGPG